MSKNPQAVRSGAERRKSRRREVLESFSLFAVVPKKGMHRLTVHDVSDHGIRFDLDLEGESPEQFPLKSGEVLELSLYLNPSLSLPLQIKVVRIEEQKQMRRVGGELQGRDTPGHQAYLAFLGLLDRLSEV